MWGEAMGSVGGWDPPYVGSQGVLWGLRALYVGSMGVSRGHLGSETPLCGVYGGLRGSFGV